MKASVIRAMTWQRAVVAAIGASLLIAPRISAQTTTGATAEMERVIVTGSNIPTAEETLALIDGKRVAMHGFGGAVGNGFTSPEERF